MFKFAKKVCFPQSHQVNEAQIFKEYHFVEVGVSGQGKEEGTHHISASASNHIYGGVNSPIHHLKAVE